MWAKPRAKSSPLEAANIPTKAAHRPVMWLWQPCA